MKTFFGRRRVFVHPFQYRLLAANIAYGLLLSLVLGCVVFLPLIVEFDSPGLSLQEKDRIAQQFLNLHNQLWPWLAVTFLIIAAHSVCFVHRVAGPIYRFRMLFRAITQGHLTIRARLRRHDYLQPDAEVLNEMLSSLEAKARDLEAQVREIQDTCERLPHLVDEQSRRRMAATHADLADRVRRLHGSISLLESIEPVARRTTEPPPALPDRPSLMREAGFTLVEIMMVLTISGALAGIAIPNYLGYLEKVRVVRAIAEISNLAKEIDGYYFSSDDTYPDSLAAIGRDTLLDPWGNPYQYLKIAGNIKGGGNGGNHARNDGEDQDVSAWAWLLPQTAYAGGGNSANSGGGSGGHSSSTQGGGSSTSPNAGGNGNQGGGDGSSGGGNVVGQARKDRFLVPINSDYDLYSMGKDGDSHAPLGAKASRDDVIRASDGAFIGLASNF